MANNINIRIEKLLPTGSKTKLQMEFNDRANNGEYIALGMDKQKLTKDQVEKERMPILFIDFPLKQKFRDFIFDLDNAKDRLFFDKLCIHPFISMGLDEKGQEKNKNILNKQYRIIDINENENAEVRTLKRMGDAIQYVRDLYTKAQYEVAYYLGADYSKLNPNQLFIALVGVATGLLHKDNNWDRVLNMEQDPIGRLRIYVNKAIVGNIIQKNGETFNYKGVYIGSNREEALFYFQTNDSIFENGLVFDVNKWDSENPMNITNDENEGNAKKADLKFSETKKALNGEADIDELYKYAQIHSSSFIGHKNWNIETLRTKVNAHKDREAAKAETLRKKTEAAEAK